jgi:hypothetical protein
VAALRQTFLTLAILSLVLANASPAAAARSVGQVIDDTMITTEVKAKLSADKLSNLTKIEVKTAQGLVTLNGVVDDPERAARAVAIASSVNGVRGIVNNLHVAGTTVPAAPIATAPAPATTVAPTAAVDATGIVASVDPATATITLQDGRVLQVTDGTAVWQPANVQTLRPGAPVMVRGATPIAVQPTAAVNAPDWRMGTVRSVDRSANVVVLTDGTVVRVAPTGVVRRGSARVAIDQIAPGSEVVIRTLPTAYGGAEGSALPGRTATGPTLDASEISVVWAPYGR